MKLNKLTILGLALASLFITSCTSNSDETTTTTSNSSEYKFTFGKDVQRAFKGTIVDQNNNPLSNVTVKINSNTTQTDANGTFTFSNITVKERFAFFTAEKQGFFTGSRTVMSHESLNSLKIMMVPYNVTKTIQTGVASSVTHGNTTVEFDGAFSLENGQSYTGAVKVYMDDMAPDSPTIFDRMPGALLGVDLNGEVKGMETFGMVNVEIKGSNNQKLQLTAGHPAKITMNIAAGKLNAAPGTMPMWFFDYTTGLWKEEGFSTKVGNQYVGSVAHFTPWNNDWAYPVAQLIVVSKNIDGTNAKGVRVEIFRPGVIGQPDHWNVPLIALGVTGNNGTLSAGVPYNELFVFRAYAATGELISEQTLEASTLATRTVYVNIGVLQRGN